MGKKLSDLYLELTRRRLPQTGAWYVAVAWGGTEILVFLTDALLGEAVAAATRRYLAILLIAGFPAAMYLAWTRDLGLKARRLLSAGVVGVLVVAALVVIVPEERTVPLLENSIAVLPFDVCADRQSDKPLANGVAAAVHGRLSERASINVKGWASVRSVLQTDPPLPVMADLLGVKYFLEGVVCREGRDPTLNVELVDSFGTVVWRNDFKQVANDFDQVEVQMAELVDNGVAREFGDASAATRKPAVNREALMQVRIAQGYRFAGDLDSARQAFEEALRIEPGFAEAIYGQARLASSDWTPDTYGLARKEALDTAEKAIATARAAVQRDPRDFEANLFAGEMLHFLADWGGQVAFRESAKRGDEVVSKLLDQSDARFAEAQRYLEAALAVRPDDSEAIDMAAHNMESLGPEMRRAALAFRERALVNDPFSVSLARSHARRLVEFGDVPGAMDLLDTFGRLPQGKRNVWWQQLESLNNVGRHDELLEYFIEMAQEDPGKVRRFDFGHIWRTTTWIAHLGLYEEADTLYHQVYALNPGDRADKLFRRMFVNSYMSETGNRKDVVQRLVDEVSAVGNEVILDAWYVLSMQYVSAFWEVGQRERAIELMEALAKLRHIASGWAEREMMFPYQLAEWYFAVGRDSDALALLESIVEHLEADVLAGVRHPDNLRMLAGAYGWQGKNERALKTLEMAVDFGAFDMRICCEDYWSEEVRAQWATDPMQRNWWDNLDGNPKFELIRTDMRSTVDAQRAKIRLLLAQNDMEELLKPWTTPESASVAAN